MKSSPPKAIPNILSEAEAMVLTLTIADALSIHAIIFVLPISTDFSVSTWLNILLTSEISQLLSILPTLIPYVLELTTARISSKVRPVSKAFTRGIMD